MVDPAVAAYDYAPYHRGVDAKAFLFQNGSVYNGVVWPGPTAYPDWFSDNINDYWNGEFEKFFSSETGLDIDFLWIDMNEPSNFCPFPCANATDWAAKNGYPPAPPAVRSPPSALPGFPCDFQPKGTNCNQAESSKRSAGGIEIAVHQGESRDNTLVRRAQVQTAAGLPGRDLLHPEYRIHNALGELSDKTARTDLAHANGLKMYDTHNLYGTMMSAQSRKAMLARRPGRRPLVITRSTFPGAGAHVGHWLGDNNSDWPHYLWSIRGLLQFASIFQVPMVGSDVCGFGGSATEELCARWAMLGAFSTFYRNHNEAGSPSQEFYVWPTVAAAARKAIDIRYRLLDYMYTALHEQSTSGTPGINPMFYYYPSDKNTFGIDTQYFYGPGLLVAPVTAEGSTSVDVYLPKDVFYNFYTGAKVVGAAKNVTMTNQTLTDIPLFLRGGVIVPLRVESAMTTTEVRSKDFELVIPLNSRSQASGSLYLDDGDSIDQKATSLIQFVYKNGKLGASGNFGYQTNSKLVKITVLGWNGDQKHVKTVSQPLTKSFSVKL